MTREASIPIHTKNRNERAPRWVNSLLVAVFGISLASRTFGQTQPDSRLVQGLSQASGSPEQRLPRGERQRAGAVIGVLRSEQGTPLSGSRVVLWARALSEKTKTRRSASTSFETTANGDGMFVFRDIPPGTYTMRVIFAGFEVLTKDHILINPGDSASVELAVKPIANPVPKYDSLPRAAAIDDKPAPADPEIPALAGLIQRTDIEVAQQQAQQATGEGRDVRIPFANRWGYGYR